ncbi:hypothetical protein BG006_009421 [Podila minutissima]|uniref:Uncharacterized protein n=1 Tax=Podila minutissima TaxID=64525 RepID=A0A9P5SIA2_9FUNG|nr:hypothetical protein BG006_009421 [Podila minutissima]
MFQDVFSELFSILYDRLEGLTIFESALRPIVRDEFLSVQETLAAHAYPNFSSGTKLRLVVDEAQILSDKGIQLVEAAFGRIKIFGGTARTVLDEPFVLKATFNYFREKDPSFVSAAEQAMLHSDNASVHRNMWQAMMPLKSQPLSS